VSARGWKNLQGADGTQFKNQGQCVSYAARGGTLVAIQSEPVIAACFNGSSVVGTASGLNGVNDSDFAMNVVAVDADGFFMANDVELVSNGSISFSIDVGALPSIVQVVNTGTGQVRATLTPVAECY
jgi:hypothetical protein